MAKSKKVTKKATKKAISPAEDYNVVVKILGKNYESTGKTIIEALNNLDIRNVRGKCIMTVSKGNESKERVLMPAIVYRMLNTYGVSKEIAIKNVSLMFSL